MTRFLFLMLLSFLYAGLYAGRALAAMDYSGCMALVGTDPVKGAQEARAWVEQGGGAPARHCLAAALIGQGARARAADELMGIAAEEPDLDDRARADILVQAGDLLLDLDDPITAMVVSAQALRLVPDMPDALRLRAAVRMAQDRPQDAVQDLDLALEKKGPDPALLRLRATARRHAGDKWAARDDALWATELAPEDPQTWLERGRSEAALGDYNAARHSLMQAIMIDPKSTIAKDARLSLQRMEAGQN